MSLPIPSHFSIRLLLPIHLTAPTGQEFAERLTSATFDGTQLWRTEKLHPKYTEETLRETVQFLFPDDGTDSSVHYFGLAPKLTESWFRPVVATVPNGAAEERWRKQAARTPKSMHERPIAVPLSLDYKYGIELFVLHRRVGLLSICFAEPCRPNGHPALGVTETRALQYHFSHMKYRTPVLRIPHPVLDAFAPSGELPLEEEHWLTDPLEGRLGRPGQPFTLVEVRDLLLAPIHSSIAGYEQNQFLVHTVLRFDKQTSFADQVLRSAYAQELVAFAQIEEVNHAPAAPDNLGLPNEVLNANHLVAYSYLGGAHFVADQWESDRVGGSFDADRVEGVQRKYFTAFLATVTERLIAHSFLEEAVRRKLNKAPIGDIWERFTEFEPAAQLIDVSRREAVNRCYRLAQRAQRIPETIGSLHRVFRDAQASEQAQRQAAMLVRQTEQAERQGRMLEHQNQLAVQQHEMLQAQEETRRRLGLIEIFVVTVYTAELVHILGTGGEFPHVYTFGGVALLSLLALWTVLGHHRSAIHGGKGPRRMMAISILTLVLWVACGFAWKFREYFRVSEKPLPTAAPTTNESKPQAEQGSKSSTREPGQGHR